MSVLEKSKLKTVNLAPRIGVEIQSDVETLLSGTAATEIRELLEERGVVVFREINFTDDQQVAFTKTLGHVSDEGEKGIYKVTLDTRENPSAEYLKGAFYWHIDGTMSKSPILASLLSGRVLSPTAEQ